MRKRVVLSVLGAAVAAVVPASMARANLTGFTGFAPINATSSDAGAVSTDANIGYTSGGANFVLTDNSGAEGTSGFAAAAQNISGSWTASFSYQETLQVYSTSNTGSVSYVAADGFALVLQNDSRGTGALGGDGGAFGYGTPPTNNTNTNVKTITPSAAIALNNFNNTLSNGGAIGFNVNGTANTPNGLGTVNISAGTSNSSNVAHTINVTYTYDAGTGTLREMFVDPSAAHGTNPTSKYVHLDTGVNLASTLGSSTALVGFTGATGGFNAGQTISNFSFTTGAAGASAGVVPGSAVFTPIPLASSSFNQALVVPASASGTGTSTSNPVAADITATMDDGPAFTATSSGNTFFEKGFVASATSTPSNPSAGVPTSGSTFTTPDNRHSFVMPTFGVVGTTPIKDAVLLDDGDTAAAGDKSATITFATPTAFTDLSFLTATGNGPGLFTVTANYLNGTSTLLPGDVTSPDWFGSGNLAYATGGRFEVDNDSYDIHSNGQPDLWDVDVALTDVADPIQSLTLNYDGGDRSEVAIFSVSGAVPEPASLGMIGLAGLGLLRRRSGRN